MPYTSLGQAWTEGKGEHAMSRFQVDCGRETGKRGNGQRVMYRQDLRSSHVLLAQLD